MRVFSAVALLLVVAACDRPDAAPQTIAVPAAQPAPVVADAAPAVASSVAKPASRLPRKAGTATRRKSAPEDFPSANDHAALLDFQAEQEQRDRQLMERDADEANALERDEAWARERAEARAAEDGYWQAPEDDLAPDEYDLPPEEYDFNEPPLDDEFNR